MTNFLNRDLYIGLFIWACLWAVLASFLPAFPVDETRYLTVAWEMRHSGDYLLPTLNQAPYSHKPPMLFWLINLVWSVTGISIGAARVIPLLSSLATFALTIILARRMFPGDARDKISSLSGLVLMASPAFMVYGVLIMFDFMQAVFVVAAMIAAWDAYTNKRFKSWLLFGLATGLGALAKGPVILVHVLPVVLLFPVLMGKQWNGPRLKHWYAGVAFAVVVALIVGLAWAIPAAIHGGPAFTHMIFWEQSAGRMTKSFAHRQPFWFYVPIMIAFLLPLLCWGPFWSAAKRVIQSRRDPAILFLLCWTVPVFIIFSLISGKQAHYLIPMIPGVAIMIARFVAEKNQGPFRMRQLSFVIPVVIGFIIFAAIKFYPGLPNTEDARYLTKGVHEFSTGIILGRLAAVIIFAYALSLSARLEGKLLSMMMAFAIFLGTVLMESDRKLFDYYDLRPLTAELEKYKAGPMAFAPEYSGEIGFLGRLEKPLAINGYHEIGGWLRQNRKGVAVIRYKDKAEIKAYRELYTMPYRGSGFISIVKAK